MNRMRLGVRARIVSRLLPLLALPSLLLVPEFAGTAAIVKHEFGPTRDPAFFPIAVWWQQANQTGHSGAYPNAAAAAVAAGMNIFLGQGVDWPEHFGRDEGEMEAIRQYGLYLVGGINVPYDNNTSPHSVASILALTKSLGAQKNLIGYNAGDEPQCVASPGQTPIVRVPEITSGIASYDPTRIVTFNEVDWMIQPQWQHSPPPCLQWEQSALQATSVASFDEYPLTSPYIAAQLGVGGTNYLHISNDSLWLQGLSVQALRHFALPGQPLWVYIESGSDNFGLSAANNTFAGGVTKGSQTLVDTSGAGRFSAAWLGLQVSGNGIPPGTIIDFLVDATHAGMSAPATATLAAEPVSVTGGTNADCLAKYNLCVVNGNRFRPTPAEVNAEVWMSIINGATGIEYFCHDSTTYSFCLGDRVGGGALATKAFDNLAYVDRKVLGFAPILNAPTIGQCSMEQLDFATGSARAAKSCTDGSLTVHSADRPGAALAKRRGSKIFLFAQPDHRSAGGSTFTFTLAGQAGRMATVVYDSNAHYDPAHSAVGKRIALDGRGEFSDLLGANQDDYEVRAYEVE